MQWDGRRDNKRHDHEQLARIQAQTWFHTSCFRSEQSLQCVLIQFPHRQFMIRKKDTITPDTDDLIHVHDITTVYSDEFLRGQLLLHMGQRGQHQELLAGNDDPGIVLHRFEIKDIRDTQFMFLMPLFDHQRVRSLFLFKGKSLVAELAEITETQRTTGKTLGHQRFQQVVEGFYLVTFDGEFGMRSDKYREQVVAPHSFDQLQSGDARHFNVDKNDVRMEFGDQFRRFERVRAGGYPLQKREFGSFRLDDQTIDIVILYDQVSQWFIHLFN